MTLVQIVLTGSLSLAIVSSFFIIENFHIYSTSLPQLFYLFLFIVFVCSGIKYAKLPAYRLIVHQTWSRYGKWIVLFLSCIVLNLLFYFFKNSWHSLPFFAADIGRVIANICFAMILLAELTHQPRSRMWILGAFLVPLVLSVILVVRNSELLKHILPSDFFSENSLQAFQHNPTSLATWLIITFSVCISYLWESMKHRDYLHRVFLFLGTILSASLVWWTHSRGALLGAVAIAFMTLFLSYRKQRTTLWIGVLLIVAIFSVAKFILPLEIQKSITQRYYPNSTSHVVPDFTHSQDRQHFWPNYIVFDLNHPLGAYGPRLAPGTNDIGDGEHNTLLQAGRWGGWGALSLVGMFLFYLFSTSYKTLKENTYGAYAIAITSSLVGIFILLMLNNFLQLKQFWIIAACVIALRSSSHYVPMYDSSATDHMRLS